MARWRPEAILSLLFSMLLVSACVTTGVSPQDKKRAAAAINLGEAYMGGGNYTAALGELLKAEKLVPNDPILHNDLGWYIWPRRSMIWPWTILKKRCN
jgi:Tfp pilus assembly protein PilF